MSTQLTIQWGPFRGAVLEVDRGSPFSPTVFPAIAVSFDTEIVQGQRHAAIKYAEAAESHPDKGNRLGVEEHVYSVLTGSSLAEHALTYLGGGEGSGTKFIVVERAVASLDRFYSAPEDVRVALAARALRSTIDFLLALDAERGRMVSPDLPLAHRDITPANVFVVERDGQYITVIGDFGFALTHRSAGDNNAAGVLAPEQVSGDALASLQTDLWGAALAAWILLHGGVTPYRAPGGGWLPEAHARPESGEHEVSLVPPTPRDQQRAPRSESGLTLSRLVNEVLSARNGAQRLACVRSVSRDLDEIVGDVAPWAVDGEFGRRLKDLAAAPTAGAADRPVNSSLADLLRQPPSARPDRGHKERQEGRARAAAERAERRKRLRGYAAGRLGEVWSVTFNLLAVTLHALRGLPLALGVALATVALSTVAAFFQLMPLPLGEVDSVQQWGTAAVLAVLGIVLVGVSVLRRIATPSGDRLPHPCVWPLVAGVLAAGMTAAVTSVGLLQPWSLRLAAVCAGAGLAAIGMQARVGRWAGMRARRAPRRRVGRVLRSAFVLALGVVLVVAPFVTPMASALADHEVDAPVTGFVPGMTSDAPVFFDPRSIAVNSKGDVAVVDSVGAHRDSIWIVPGSAQEAPFRLLLTDAPSPTPGVQGALQEVPEDSTDWRLAIADSIRGGSETIVRDVVAVAFADDDSLILAGQDGVSRLDFDRGTRGLSGTTLTRLSSDPAVTSAGTVTAVLVHDETAYVQVYATGSSSGGSAHSYPYCRWTDTQTTPRVYTLDLASDSRALTGVTRVDDNGRQCVDATRSVYVENGTVRQIRELPTRGSEPNAYEVADLNGADGTGSPIVGPLPDGGLRAAVTDGEHLVLNSGFCIASRAPDGAPTAAPVAVEPVAGADCPGAEDDVADEVPTCDAVGRGPLWTDSSFYQPLAVGGPDGEIYVAAPGGEQCTALILRLPKGEDQWTPVGRVRQQSDRAWDYVLGETSVMSAQRPELYRGAGGGFRWYSGSRAWFFSGPRGTNADGFPSHLYTYPVEVQRLGEIPAGEDGPAVTNIRVSLLSTSQTDVKTGQSTPVTGVLVGGWIDGVQNQVRVPLAGVTDLEVVGNRLFYARCGQIGSFETDDLRALVRQGRPADDVPEVTIDGDAKSPRELPGRIGVRIWLGDPDLAAPCTLPSGPPVPVDEQLLRTRDSSDAESGPTVDSTLSAQGTTTGAGAATRNVLQIAPAALDVKELSEDQYEFTFAEASVFGDVPVSRIRVADTQTDRVVTVGFDPEDPRHRDEASEPTGTVLAGDLLQRGVIATDVAVSSTGVVAVSTLTHDGTGPLLLIEGNRTTTVTSGASMISGVAWSDDHTVIVTDVDRGDVKLLDVAGALDSHEPPIVRWFSWLPFSTAHEERSE